ncbi:MAG: SUMF1/EgtB/PvdO family nonheme iron enzyme, partial [Clostridia bacterium]|nr:SUMF1/EgtB/PvdO family nonheme iron enzyme [Clostridia bacterium]
YDIAGNMWEWTTEVSKNGSKVNNRVLRGGSYNSCGSDNPASYRYGNDSVTYTNMNLGFRPQLFIQM